MEQPVRLATAFLLGFSVYRIVRYRDMIKLRILLLTLFLSACIVVALVIDGSYTNGYVLLLMGVLNGAIVTSFITVERFYELYIKIISFLAVVSMVCTYLLKPLMSRMTFFFIPVTNSAGIPFYDAHLCYVHSGAGYIRNYGIFREPGVYAIFLCLGLAFLIFGGESRITGKKRLFFIVTLALTLISTFSTTGYVALLMIALAAVLTRRVSNSKKLTVLAITAFIVMILAFLFVSQGFENPLDKFNSSSRAYSSFLFRMETIVQGAYLSLIQPFGYGIQRGIEALRQAFTLSEYHNTSTWVSMSVYLGVPYFITCLITVFQFFRGKMKSWLLFIPFFLLLSGETLLYNPFVYVLAMYGVTVPVFSRVRFKKVSFANLQY